MLERIASGRTDLVFEWIANGGDPDAAPNEHSLIVWCAYYGDVSAIRYLRSQGVALDALGPDIGLNGAAFHGHWRLCEYLIEQGASARSALPDTGETPLHAAFCSNQSIEHERVVDVLLFAGADVHAATIPGVETGGFMRDVRTRGETPLHRAAAFGTPYGIKAVIDAGAALDAKDSNGDTPLTWASWALRDTFVLNLLCYPPFKVNPDRQNMKSYLVGQPRAD